jgi:hypothetical protein
MTIMTTTTTTTTMMGRVDGFPMFYVTAVFILDAQSNWR